MFTILSTINGVLAQGRAVHKLAVLLFWCLLACSQRAVATIRYVKQTATGTTTGGSWANASADIQAMINASASGDTIWVAKGTYKPNRRADATGIITTGDRNDAFVLKSGIKIYGGFAGAEISLAQRTTTIIAANPSILSGDLGGNDGIGFTNNAENAWHVVISAGDVGTATLDGFTIRGGNTTGNPDITVYSQHIYFFGGGVACQGSSPTLANLILKENYGQYGGGIGCQNSSPSISNTTFTTDSARDGGAIYLSATSLPTLANVLVAYNMATDNGGSMFVEFSSVPVLINSTISGNTTTATGAGVGNIYLDGGGIKIYNSIVYANNKDFYTVNSPVLDIKNSMVQANADLTNGNISSTPGFVSSATGNYRLQACSPGINTGSNAAIPAGITTDLDGNLRQYNSSTVDMGAYEYQGTAVAIAITAQSATHFCPGGSVTMVAPVADSYLWAPGGQTTTSIVANTTGSYSVAIANATGCSGTTAAMAVTANPPTNWYVDSSVATSGNGMSWATAYKELRDALAARPGCAIINIAKGTYKPTSNNDRDSAFTLLYGNMKMLGGYPSGGGTRNPTANPVYLDGNIGNTAVSTDNSYHVMVIAGVDATTDSLVLDGFTLRNGYANGGGSKKYNGKVIAANSGGGLVTGKNYGSAKWVVRQCSFVNNYCLYYGGGMYNDTSDASITNCTFSGNHGTLGGGMYNIHASPKVNNSSFIGNSGWDGGGVYNTSSNSFPVFTNVTITGNSTYDNGGGMANDDYAVISLTNVTISGNTAGYGGGGMANLGNTLISAYNVIASGNTADFGGGLYGETTSFNFYNSLISGNKANANGGGYFGINSANLFLQNCTMAGNHAVDAAGGGAIYIQNNASAFLETSIIWGNIPDVANDFSNIRHSSSLVEGFDADPLFINAPSGNTAPFTQGDYRVQSCSPAINAAKYPAVGDTDLAGNPRTAGGKDDIGAYEFIGSNNGNPSGADLLGIDGDVAAINIVAAQSNMLMATSSACRMVAAILPDNTATQVSGNVSAKTRVDATLAHNPANGFPYVQRHYDITPATNAANATAFVTLYFTQAEFNTFNADPKVGSSLALPTATGDASGIARLRIFQYHGTSSDGSGLPASYGSNNTIIDPADANINWNNTLQRWEVGFPVTGFSGFFAGVDGLNLLPVTLLSFTASLTANQTVRLQCYVAEQTGIKNYVVERSTDGSSFKPIGSLASNNLAATTYAYTDALLPITSTLYYRLSIVGVDGTVTYSSIASVKLGGINSIIIYPNPARSYFWLQGGNIGLIGTDAYVTDMQGRVVCKTLISQWPVQMNTSTLADGVYLIKLAGNQTFKLVIGK